MEVGRLFTCSVLKIYKGYEESELTKITKDLEFRKKDAQRARKTQKLLLYLPYSGAQRARRTQRFGLVITKQWRAEGAKTAKM
jgi:hypothetical protein